MSGEAGGTPFRKKGNKFSISLLHEKVVTKPNGNKQMNSKWNPCKFAYRITDYTINCNNRRKEFHCKIENNNALYGGNVC